MAAEHTNVNATAARIVQRAPKVTYPRMLPPPPVLIGVGMTEENRYENSSQYPTVFVRSGEMASKPSTKKVTVMAVGFWPSASKETEGRNKRRRKTARRTNAKSNQLTMESSNLQETVG